MNNHGTWSRIRVLLLLVSVLSVVALSGENKVKSRVTAATVYSDRALVTRTMEEQLTAGVQSVLIADLPVTLVDQSLRVTGEAAGSAKILDVKCETVFLDTIPEERIRQLQDRMKQLRFEEQTLSNRQTVLRSQMSLVDSLKLYYPRDPRNLAPGQKSSFDEWDKMLGFLDRNLTASYAKVLEINGKLEDVRSKIESTNREISQTRGYSKKSMKQLRVDLDVARAGMVKLDVSYLIHGANWSPQYETRVGSESASLQFIYSGSVSQSTGEDWINIELTLSTAQPAYASLPANLYPWVVDLVRPRVSVPGRSTARMRTQIEPMGQGSTIRGSVRDLETRDALIGVNVVVEGLNLGASTDLNGSYVIRNVPSGIHNVRVTYIGYSPYTFQNARVSQNMSTWVDFDLAPSAVQIQAVAIMAERENQKDESVMTKIETETAQVQTQATSSVFKIPSRANIPSDNNPHKVGIMAENLPVQFQYVAMPKLAPAAFLSGKVKNSTEYPFLAGPMNVFFENSFVATSNIGTTFPQEWFDSNLGADEGVRLERKLVNRFTENTGTFTKKVKVTYDIVTTVQNLKSKEISISIQDQIPISRNEGIVVEQIEPDLKAMPADASGVLKWDLQMKPGDKRTLKLKFSVEYPRDIQVQGLE